MGELIICSAAVKMIMSFYIYWGELIICSAAVKMIMSLYKYLGELFICSAAVLMIMSCYTYLGELIICSAAVKMIMSCYTYLGELITRNKYTVLLNEYKIYKKKFLSCGPQLSAEFSAPREFSGNVPEKHLCKARARIIDLQFTNQRSQHPGDDPSFLRCSGI